MKRLTKRYDNGRAYLCVKTKAKGHEGVAEAHTKAINRLAELEDKLESGLILEMPCKVGDTLYYVEYFCCYKGCSSTAQQSCCGCKEMLERERNNEKYVISEKKFTLRDLPLIGEKYFTDKSQAEAKLKELQSK